MEILRTFDKDDDSHTKDEYLLFKEHRSSLFTDSTNSIINNSNLAIRILQDIKRRDEVRELYNTHKKRELKKKELLQKDNNNSLFNSSNEVKIL